jgi:hypothetical protein
MNKTEIILSVVYLIGFLLSYSMLKVERESEEKVFTRLDRIIGLGFSLFSFLVVLILLVSAWFKIIGASGYWDKPVKQTSK